MLYALYKLRLKIEYAKMIVLGGLAEEFQTANIRFIEYSYSLLRELN